MPQLWGMTAPSSSPVGQRETGAPPTTGRLISLWSNSMLTPAKFGGGRLVGHDAHFKVTVARGMQKQIERRDTCKKNDYVARCVDKPCTTLERFGQWKRFSCWF